MIKHIFCDLDGTLYNKGKMSKEDIEAIEEIEKEGVVFHVATGRVSKQAYKIVENNGLKLNGYFICENGSFIHDKDKKLIFKKPLDEHIVKKIINTFDSKTSYIYLKYNGEIILNTDKDISAYYTSDYRVDKKVFESGEFKGLVGNVGVVSKDIDELKRLEYYYKSELKDICDVYLSGKYTLNIVPNSASKRYAIEYLCKMNNISLDEIATIGDSPNDICMLKDLKYSFAINRLEEVKKISSYNVDSVKEAIEIIKKINRVK